MKETKQEIRKQYLYFSESEQELEKAGVGVTMPDHQGGEPVGGELPLPDHQGNQGWDLPLPDHQGDQGWGLPLQDHQGDQGRGLPLPDHQGDQGQELPLPDHQGGEPEVAVTTTGPPGIPGAGVTTAGPPGRPGVGGIQMQEPGKTEPIKGPRRLPSKHTLAQRYTWKTVHCVLNPYILEIRKKVKITRSSLTLCNPMDYTVHGILQARIPECITIPFSRGSSQPRDRIQVSCIASGFFTS